MIKKLSFLFFAIVSPLLILLAQVEKKGIEFKPVYQKGHWGYADASGKLVIEPRFDAALPFKEGLARVGVVDEELPELDARPNLLWGYIDERGREIVPIHYNALHDFSEGLAACGVFDPELAKRSAFARRGTGDFRWGYLNREGQVVIPLQYFAAGPFTEGLAAVDAGGERDGSCDRARHFGYLDKTGAFVIKPQFASATAFQNGRARVSIGYTRYEGRCLCCAPRFVGKHGFVDRGGTFVADQTTGAEDSINREESPQ